MAELKISHKAFAGRILQFCDELAHTSLSVPAGFRIINPFRGDHSRQVKDAVRKFYKKYYNDTASRRLILGSSPARLGSAVTGIPFEDAKHIQDETGVCIDGRYINRPSASFLDDVIAEYGGRQKFYSDFYMGFVCPLGIVRTNAKGNTVNCNYYEDTQLLASLSPFIESTLLHQMGFGIDPSVCYCIGSGENYRYLSDLNKKHHLFGAIIPLEHPRYIMQYKAKEKGIFLEKYISALCS